MSQKIKTNWLVLTITGIILTIILTKMWGCGEAQAMKMFECPELIEDVKTMVDDNKKDIFLNQLNIKENKENMEQIKKDIQITKEETINLKSIGISNNEDIDELKTKVDKIYDYIIEGRIKVNRK